jgi:HEAT repeat protein
MTAAILLLAGLALGDDKAADEAIKKFKTAMRNPSVPSRQAAVSELAREKHEKTARVLCPLLMGDAAEVRVAAAQGLAGYGDYKRLVVPQLMGALGGPNQKEPKVRAAVLAALGKLNDDSSVPMIYQAFKDDYITVAKAAVMATVDLKRKEAIDQLIELMKQCQKWAAQNQGGGYKDDEGKNGDENAQKGRVADLQKAIMKALQDMTTEKWPSAEEWVLWWAKKKDKFEFAKEK